MATAALPKLIDEPFYEVVNGERVECPPMGGYENELAFLLGHLLAEHAMPQGLGRAVLEVLFRLESAPDLQRKPDVAFVSAAKWPLHRRVPKAPCWDMIPDLAVEVVSPTNTAAGIMGKVEEYFRAGVSLVWVVYPDTRRVYVYESPKQVRILGDGDTIVGDPVVPGFRVGVTELFGDESEIESP